MDVAAWLQGLGLERYEASFRDNEIDWQVAILAVCAKLPGHLVREL
jgi:hypothetical protein